MSPVQILALLCALSVAVNVAFAAGLLARLGGESNARAILVGGGAAATTLGLYLAAQAAY